MISRFYMPWTLAVLAFSLLAPSTFAQQSGDYLRQMQLEAIENEQADWAHWGRKPEKYSDWTNHSNRLIPAYVFGGNLDSLKDGNSVYRSKKALKRVYGFAPERTHNPNANYFDQTGIYRLQKDAIAAGKKYVILMVFDGMDYETSRAAAIYKQKEVAYQKGRGTGLSFLDYRGTDTSFGFFVTSPHNSGTDIDVDGQIVKNPGGNKKGGFNVDLGGGTPWAPAVNDNYLVGKQNDLPHVVTDSAASATSMNSGIKTYNAAINVDFEGNQVAPIARDLQERGFAVGAVSSVPISHATPAATYANNVTRNDYQDLTRDMLGIRSIAHRDQALSGLDVLIGCGWGELTEDDRKKQGQNYIPGNKYLPQNVLNKIDANNGGKYVVAQRTPGKPGQWVLSDAAETAVKSKKRLFGFFGVDGGHLPYQTADGQFDPTRSVKKAERYTDADVAENPTLAEMTEAALSVLHQRGEKGFWLMIEPGDVDWANHGNNVDNSIGAVISGEAAFDAVTSWVEKNNAWDDTLIIVTADHGHYLNLDQPEALTGKPAKQDK